MANANVDEHPGLGTGLGRLQGKVAIVTGANSGIGRATARLFAREGAKIVCCDIQEDTTPRIDKLIGQDEGQAVFMRVDVTLQADCDRMVSTALEKFGDLDILFNNAGTGVRKFIHELTDDEWNFVVNVNLNALFLGVRAAIPHFLKKGRGNIVNTASTFGLLASEQYPGYCATKAAIINLTRQMALDYGCKGIRVNCVCPGAIETPRFRGFPPRPTLPLATEEQRARMAASNRALLRFGRPEEIAYGVLFLVSDEASFVTGHALVIDGGQTIDA
ncbi:MAG: SDR family oxidoreductase [Deltaproteobacteria bacterium]|nr:SDR family oxidoreductase [Deltaproteobacteria bacterium]